MLGFDGLDVFMPKLVRAIESDGARERITSTLTLLKLRKRELPTGPACVVDHR